MEAGAKRIADYSYIPPGDYTFRVTACNNDGVWNDAGAQAAFTVLPYFWQRMWFRGLGGGMTAVAGGGIGLFAARRRMRPKLQRPEQQPATEEERGQNPPHNYDDLGAHPN